ncbi:MAG: tetratricopeptide repeat protein, partial [Flammeovirgaceae bacterium]|nr:tetratricopeptide repeat protein [Flammeovirgaceae bacterium]
KSSEKIDIYLQLSALERGSRNTAKALSYTEEAFKLTTEESAKHLREKVFLEKALIYLQADNTSAALDYAINALVINEKRNDINRLIDSELTIAKIYASDKLYEKALEHLQKAITYSESKKDARYFLALEQKADALFYAEKYGEAVEEYEKLLKQNDTASITTQNRILQKLSIAAKNSNQLDKAIETAQKSLALCEKDKNLEQTAYVANSLGYLYRQKKDLTLSTQYFEKALQNLKAIDKKDHNVLNNIGVTYSNLGKHDEAKRYYMQASNLSKEHPEAYVTSQNYLAVNHYAVGNYRQALQEVQKAIEVGEANKLDEPLAESYLVQQEIYKSMKDLANAQQAYQSYLAKKEAIDKAKNRQSALLQQKRIDAEQKENQIRLAINEQEKQEIEFQRLRLEKEKNEVEIANAAKNLALLAKEAELKESKLRNQALEKERAEQALKIAQKELEEEKKQRQLEELKQKQELQELALKQQELEKKEQQKALELLKKEQELKEREAEEERFRNRIFYAIGFIVLIALIYVTYLLLRVKKQSKVIKQQTEQLDVQNQALKASEEELKQNLEELQVTQEMLQKQKGEL